MKLHSIQSKLRGMFLLILLPLVIMAVFSNYYSQRILNKQVVERTEGALLTALEYVEQLTKSMDQQTLLISSNPNIVEVWQYTNDPLRPDNLYDIRAVQQQLTALTNVNGALKEAIIVHGKSGNGISTQTGGIKWPNLDREKWFQQTVSAAGGLIVFVPSEADNEIYTYLDVNKVYYMRLLDVFTYGQDSNVMILAVDKSSFQTIIQHLQTTPNTNISLYYNDEFVLETNASISKTSEKSNMSIKVNNDFWSIKLEQPTSEIYLLSQSLKRFTYVIIAISIFLAIWIAWLAYTNVSRPFQQLLNAFKQFSSGDFKVQLDHRRKDEIGYLMNAFNRMAVTQRKMIEENYEKELRLSEARFNLLQSQINPHFLYNTLDSIYSVSLKYGVSQISEMVINLARFFRVSLGKGKDYFTLEETTKHLLYYLRIQQIRSYNFTIVIELEEETKSYRILRFILQPIVENAIIHGLNRKIDGGELRIKSTVMKELLIIHITDTGVGIPPTELEKINLELSKIKKDIFYEYNKTATPIHIGLSNVKSRLKLYYGEHADLIIQSKENEWTRVSIIIPLNRVMQE